jgi:hypothetical protein
MKRGSVYILISFFVTLCVFLSYRAGKGRIQQDLIRRSLSDQALSYFDASLQALTSQQIELQQKQLLNQELSLEKQRLQTQSKINSIPFYSRFWMVSAVMFAVAGAVGVLVVFAGAATGIVIQRSVFTAKINGCEYPVKYQELKTLHPAIIDTARALIESSLRVNDELTQERKRTDMQDMAALFNSLGLRRGGGHTIEIQKEEEQQSLPGVVSIPSFRSILQSLTPGEPMVIGYDHQTGEASTGDFNRIYSCGFFGLSRTGKTTGLISLVCQTLLVFPAIHFVVLDPHHNRKDSLTAGLPHTGHFTHLDPHDFRTGLQSFARQLDLRLLNEAEDYTDRPMVLIVDELPVILKHEQGASAEAILERIASEGAKVSVYCMISGQDTRLRGSGNARDLLCSSLAYRLSKKQARYLLDDAYLVDLHETVREAKTPGLCLFNPTDDEAVLLQQPQCLPADVRYVEQCVGTLRNDDMFKDCSENPGTSVPTEELPAILRQVLAYLETPGRTLSKFCEQAGTPKGSLSDMLHGKRSLSNEMAQKLMDFFGKLEEKRG